jgi:hypothetical protein
MATKSPENLLDKMPAKIRKAFLQSISDAVEMHNRLEMSNIPDDCWESAAASWLAVERKPICWVNMNLTTGKSFAYDLRSGREAKDRA